MSKKQVEVTSRTISVLSKFPCYAINLPASFRGELPKIEKLGLGFYDGTGWVITSTGLDTLKKAMAVAK